MQKLALFAGVVVMALGVTAASSSAFAMGCLNNQNAMITPSLTDSLMPTSGTINGSGSGANTAYDVGAYNAVVAQGNACPSTQQSLSTDQHSRVHQNAVN